MRSKCTVLRLVILAVVVLAQGCAADVTRTPSAVATDDPTPPATSTQAPPELTQVRPVATASEATPLPQSESTALPSDLRVTWGEWWYEGEYLADAAKYPTDPQYHDRSFNIRVTIQNSSSDLLPGDILPVFFLTDGDGERPVITWYYSQDDLRALGPGEKKEAVFRALTYAPGQWIVRAEIVWRGQVWEKELPKQ